ncbi:unnamed protein product [Blepharisma stoltei]|uniref:RING-type domain-containing protein n=1 Tax=Blepharisma stoltei TaxID=1481888 RepID=A0AAU9JDL2_9CILI|nr:unnamed protein product [Blepharisma stoltei]
MDIWEDICRVILLDTLSNGMLTEEKIKEIEEDIDGLRLHKELDAGFNIKHSLDGHFEGMEIQLTNCQKNHCLQCLEKYFELQSCEHNVKFTRFEQKNIPWQLEVLKNLESDVLFKIKNGCCFSCNSLYKLKSLMDQKCFCRVCDACIYLNYSERILSCPSCKREYDRKDIKEIYEIGTKEKPGEKIPLFDRCSICKGIFDEDAFFNKCLCGCYVCILCKLNIEECPNCKHHIEVKKEAEVEEEKVEEESSEEEEEEEEKNEIGQEHEEEKKEEEDEKNEDEGKEGDNPLRASIIKE